MRKSGKRLAVVLAIAAGAAAIAFGALWAYASAEFTECNATFRSAEHASAAASELEALDHDTDVTKGNSHVSIAVQDGETGDDAAAFRADFERVVRSEGGTLSPTGGLCFERPRFD